VKVQQATPAPSHASLSATFFWPARFRGHRSARSTSCTGCVRAAESCDGAVFSEVVARARARPPPGRPAQTAAPSPLRKVAALQIATLRAQPGQNARGLPLTARTAISIERRAALESELARELPPNHVSSGRRVTPIAASAEEDDVLFEVAGVGLAVVHLTWSGRQESSPVWPRAQLLATFDEWRERVMLPDHHEFSA
jgi:hypothetical protein